MTDRTVKVRLEADISDFVTDIGVTAPAAIKRLEKAASSVDASLKKTATTGSQIGDGVKVGTDKATTEIDKLAAKAEKTMTSAGQRIRKTATDEFGKAGEEASASFTKSAKKGAEKTGDETGKVLRTGFKKWLGGSGSGLFSDLGKSGGTVFGSGFVGALKTPILGPAIIAILTGIFVTVMPAIGAIAAAALVSAFGAGLAGLGIIFAAQSEAVSRKWKNTLGQLGSDMKLLSQPFETTLINIADIFQKTVDKFNPALAKAFTALAAPVEGFVRSFAGSLEQLIPALEPITRAFTATLISLGPAFQQLFADLSTGLINLSDSIQKDPEALADMVRGFGNLLAMALDLVGALNDVNSQFSTLTGGFSLVDATFTGLTYTLGPLLGIFDGLSKGIEAVNILMGNTNKDVDGAGQSMSDAANDTVKLAQGLDQTGAAAQHGGPPMRTLAERMKDAAKDAADAKKEFEDFISTLFRLQNLNLTLAGAQVAVQDALAAATKSIKENGKAHQISNEKGRANYNTLLDFARAANAQTEAMIRDNKGLNAAAVSAEGLHTNFVKLAKQMGYTAPQAEALAKKFISIPDKVDTKVSNNADGPPKTAAESYAEILQGTPTKIQTTVTTNAGEAPRTVAQQYADTLQGTLRTVKTTVTNTAPVATVLADKYRYALGLTPKSKSTTISTPGATESQGKVGGLLNLLSALPASKSVTINTYRNTLETITHQDKGVRVVKADGGYHPNGVIPSYANGKLPSQATIAPGKGGGMVQWAEQETGGEAFIPLAPSKRDRSEKILGQVAGQFGMGLVRSFADGGFTLPGGRLVDIAFLLKQLGIAFNPTAGINYNSTLTAANKANRAAAPAKTAAADAARAEQSAKAQVAAIQRAITLQQRAVTAARAGKPTTKAGQAAENKRVAAEQAKLIKLQDQLYGAKKRLTVATNASNKADAVYKIRADAAAKATEAHKASIEKLIEQQKAAVDFADQISQGLTSGANIGDLFQQSLTGKGLLSDLQGKGTDLKKFGGLIAQLRGKKLNEDLIQQIIGKGADQGGELAQAILDGGLGLVAALNKAQKNLDDQANLIGAGSAAVKFGTKVAGARAGGGDVMAGKTYRVNELGKEYFTAPVDGHITPAGQDPRRYIRDMAYAGSAGSQRMVREVHNHQHLTFHGVSMDEAELIASRANAIAEFTNRGY
jgi:hypothetical protein